MITRTLVGPKGCVPLALALAVSQANAFETVYLGDNTTLDASVTLSYTASARTSSPSDVYLNSPNDDDATRNFDRGSLWRTSMVNYFYAYEAQTWQAGVGFYHDLQAGSYQAFNLINEQPKGYTLNVGDLSERDFGPQAARRAGL